MVSDIEEKARNRIHDQCMYIEVKKNRFES